MLCEQPRSGKKVMLIGHNSEEGPTKTLLTTAGDGTDGLDHVQSWLSVSSFDEERGSKCVARPTQLCRYFGCTNHDQPRLFVPMLA